MKGRTVAIYARVSTTDQNPELQLVELRKYARRRGFKVYREYVDRVSGQDKRTAQRVEFNALMLDARRRKFDVVLVWKYDRFARSLHVLVAALRDFEALNIDFISSTQDIDTTTSMGRLFFHIVGSFAEFEREMIVERVRAGLDNARANGTTLGRPRDLTVEMRIGKLHDTGVGVRAIARAVKRSPAGVVRILKRQADSRAAAAGKSKTVLARDA